MRCLVSSSMRLPRTRGSQEGRSDPEGGPDAKECILTRRITMKEAAATLDVRKFIDERPFGSYQFRVAAMCGILVFMDGFDAQMMGFVAPVLTAFLQVSRTEFGLAISSGLVGMMMGALVCGPLADHFGRKPVLVGCAFAF